MPLLFPLIWVFRLQQRISPEEKKPSEFFEAYWNPNPCAQLLLLEKCGMHEVPCYTVQLLFCVDLWSVTSFYLIILTLYSQADLPAWKLLWTVGMCGFSQESSFPPQLFGLQLPVPAREETGDNRRELRGANNKELREDRESGTSVSSTRVHRYRERNHKGNTESKKWSNL